MPSRGEKDNRHQQQDNENDRQEQQQLDNLDSVAEYLRLQDDEWIGGNGGDASQTIQMGSFDDYLKSQKARRDRRRRHYYHHGTTTADADHQQQQQQATEQPYWQQQRCHYRAHLGGEVPPPPPTRISPTTCSPGEQYSPTNRGGLRKRHVRQLTLDALQILGQRQASYSEDWQAFLQSSSGHLTSSDRDSNDEESINTGTSSYSSSNTTVPTHKKRENATTSPENDHPHGGHHHRHGGHRHRHRHDNHHHHHQLMLPFYCRPVQRQLWQDDQVLPHINWHDLFFDLIFVAAAYNLGVMLITAMNQNDWPRGCLYFVGIFGPLYTIWENDVVYASRYTLVDYAHRIVAVLRFLFVSFAVLSIKPLKLLGDKHSAETFCLVLSLFCESLVQIGLNLELYWYGDGDRKAIQNQTKRETLSHILPASLAYLEATIIAGWSLFHESSPFDFATDYHYDYYNSHLRGRHRNLGGDDDAAENNNNNHNDYYAYDNATSSSTSAEDEYNRKTGVQWSIADIPLFLCFLSYAFNILSALYQRSTHNKKIHDIREYFVPNNIDYMIHRYGEWILLMIGESILSLLIVETTEAKEYYAIEWLGCLTVIVLQMVKFESQPSHADGHALWRSMTAATLFSVLIQIISMALVAFGISYKLMLQDVLRDDLYNNSLQQQHEHAEEEEGEEHRNLAAETPHVTEKADAWLFCVSLAVVLMCLELMMVTHRGVRETYKLLFRVSNRGAGLQKWSLNYPVILISIIKLGIIAFTATLETWLTDPFHVAIAGFLIVTSMAITRIVGWGFIHHEEYINRAVSSTAEAISQRISGLLIKKTSTLDGDRSLPEIEEEEITFEEADSSSDDGSASTTSDVNSKDDDDDRKVSLLRGEVCAGQTETSKIASA